MRTSANTRQASHRRARRRTPVVIGVAAAALAGILCFVACSGAADTIGREITAGTSGIDREDSSDGGFGASDGVLPTNELTAFDTDHPGIANLEPALLQAVQDAARAAEEDDITVYVNSGWRSMEYQQHLLDAAIAEYGSEEAARQYVATPDASAHTRGAAVDIGATDADYWFIENGADFGLCQTFANEIWHFELATTPGGECPAQLPDAG